MGCRNQERRRPVPLTRKVERARPTRDVACKAGYRLLHSCGCCVFFVKTPIKYCLDRWFVVCLVAWLTDSLLLLSLPSGSLQHELQRQSIRLWIIPRNKNRLVGWLLDWLIDWLVCWLIDWLIEWWLVEWLIAWLTIIFFIDRLSSDRLIDWPIDRLIYWLLDWLIDWSIDFFINRSSIDPLTDWLIYWLIAWLIFSSEWLVIAACGGRPVSSTITRRPNGSFLPRGSPQCFSTFAVAVWFSVSNLPVMWTRTRGYGVLLWVQIMFYFSVQHRDRLLVKTAAWYICIFLLRYLELFFHRYEVRHENRLLEIRTLLAIFVQSILFCQQTGGTSESISHLGQQICMICMIYSHHSS